LSGCSFSFSYGTLSVFHLNILLGFDRHPD
jgi:hypothetical protein